MSAPSTPIQDYENAILQTPMAPRPSPLSDSSYDFYCGSDNDNNNDDARTSVDEIHIQALMLPSAESLRIDDRSNFSVSHVNNVRPSPVAVTDLRFPDLTLMDVSNENLNIGGNRVGSGFRPALSLRPRPTLGDAFRSRHCAPRSPANLELSAYSSSSDDDLFVLMPRKNENTELFAESENATNAIDHHPCILDDLIMPSKLNAELSTPNSRYPDDEDSPRLDLLEDISPPSSPTNVMPPPLMALSPHTPDQEEYPEMDAAYFICGSYSPNDFPLDLNRARVETEDETDYVSTVNLSQSTKNRKTQSMLFDSEYVSLYDAIHADKEFIRRSVSAPTLKTYIGSTGHNGNNLNDGCLAILKPLHQIAIIQQRLHNWMEGITSRWVHHTS